MLSFLCLGFEFGYRKIWQGGQKLEEFKQFQTDEPYLASLNCDETELKSAFVELISRKESCSKRCFRPFPPMLGNGCFIDLLKLYFVVKLKGGFDSISRKKSWDEVGLLYGVGSGFGAALKLIYLKYLDSLESWLVKFSSSGSSKGERFSTGVWSKGVSMALGSEYSSFVSSIMAEMSKSDESYCLKDEKSGISIIDLNRDDNEYENVDWNKVFKSLGSEGDLTEDVTKFEAEVEMSITDGVDFLGEDHDEENFKQTKSEISYVGGSSSDASDDGRSSVDLDVADNVVKSSENSCETKQCLDEDESIVDSSVVKEVSSLKRKRESMSGMLEWMVKVAKDPIDPKIGTIPESYCWGAYGNDNYWKQVLLVREALFLKKTTDQTTSQKKQKMHPSMFEDNPGCTERPRSSPRLYFEKSRNQTSFSPSNLAHPRQRLQARLDMQPTASIYTSRPYQRIPIGVDFQANIPRWEGAVTESDPKWLGTQVWPLEKKEDDPLIQTNPIGRGRSHPCGCPNPGSPKCVKLHVSRRRMELKYELGSAFYAWRFDKMGEECNNSWSSEEEKTFKLVVKENPFSHQKCFWKKMCEALPKKSWVEQVNYYFNVFMLQRRALQNRLFLMSIDSDDDETDYGSGPKSLRQCSESSSSIFSAQ